MNILEFDGKFKQFNGWKFGYCGDTKLFLLDFVGEKKDMYMVQAQYNLRDIATMIVTDSTPKTFEKRNYFYVTFILKNGTRAIQGWIHENYLKMTQSLVLNFHHE